jgi:hypothetical protein
MGIADPEKLDDRKSEGLISAHVLFGDWYVHKPGEAFFPTTEDETRRLRGVLLPGPHNYVEPDLAVSSWTSTWLRLVERK